MTINNRVGGNAYRYPVIKVNMTDRDVIARVAALFGTKVYEQGVPAKYPTRLPQFRAQVTGARAAAWMVRLRPWLGERRSARVDEVLVEYGDVEPTAVRRARSCRAAALKRYGRGL